VIAVIAVIVFAGIFMVGMLAAIAIPAYQDYTIRSQITAGLNEAAAYKAAIAQAHAGGQQIGEISSQTLPPMQPPTSPYVASIEVTNGAIAITYGGRANRLIAQKVLALVPATDEARSIVWVCGRHTPPPGTTPSIADAAQYTSIVERYLPSSCRGEAR
jgi:type IV pilus assembly protein PilA